MQREDLIVIRQIGKGKSGISYLAGSSYGAVVLKEMHNESIDYYRFSKPKTELELDSYTVLTGLEILMPRLISIHHKELYLIKEHVNGPTIQDMLICSKLDHSLICNMLSLENRLRQANINIDYFPSNFVLKNDAIYYIDYEHNNFSLEWDFSHWGIYYWLNHSGFSEYNRTHDVSCINRVNTGKPLITDEMEREKQVILESFTRLCCPM